MSKLKIRDLNKRFGKTDVLRDICFDLEEGKIYGLLGRNGAGKSTLLNLINQRIFPTSGEIFIDNYVIADNDEHLSQLFLMSENRNYPHNMKVAEAFKQTAKLLPGFDGELAQKLAQKFSLKTTKRVDKLSTGYDSIFKLIVALCVPANFVFLDEPVLGLDAGHRDLFYHEMMQVAVATGKTFVVSTHLIEEVADIIQHILILDNGEIIQDSEVEMLLAQAHKIVGPQTEVADYTSGLKVIGQESMGNLQTTYTLGNLPDRLLPDVVTIKGIPLQKLFILLTASEEETHA